MSSPTRTRRLVWQQVIALPALLFLSVAAQAALPDWTSRVAPRLLAIWTDAEAAPADKTAQRLAAPRAGEPNAAARFDQQGRVQLVVHYDCAAPPPTRSLAAAGLAVSAAAHLPPLCSIEGWLRTSDLPELASLGAVRSVDLPTYSRIIKPVTRSFSRPQASVSAVIDGNAVTITHADQFIATTGKNGAGVAIGIMSDDVASLALIQSRNELPQHITVLSAAAPGSPKPAPTDEGTMLLEELHAVAPGARLLFCAPQTDVEYVSCLSELIAAGATIVGDDLEYPAEDLMSAESSLAQGVAALLAQNPYVLLFSAAGNENESFWQGSYTPMHLASPLTCNVNGQADAYAQSFDGSPYEKLTLYDKLSAPIYLQWADPFGQNISNFDLYVMDQNRQVLECIPGAGRRAVFDSINDAHLPRGIFHFAIGTPNKEFAGKFLKLFVYGDGAAVLGSATSGGIASPQKLLARVTTVGAVYGGDGVADAIEPYSATGPIELEYPTPQSLQAPALVAPDGVYVDTDGTFFAAGSAQLFYGTSAATPNAAAIAALLRATFPGLSAARILGALQNGAAQLGAAAPNGIFGYGRVDALGALQSLPRPSVSGVTSLSIVGGSSGQIPLTLAGTGKLTLAGKSDNATLVSFGPSAAAQFVPATCGSSTNSCSVVITPALGLVGTAHLSVSVVDGAGRSALATFTLTVTTPPPPAVHVTSGGNQTVQSGNSVSPATLALSGTPHLTMSVSSSNPSLLPASSATLSSGCGTSSLNCTVTMTPAAGQAGQATVTVTALDPYGQSARGTLAVSITAPASGSGSGGGGGGAFDYGSLLILGLWLAIWGGAAATRLTGAPRSPV
jgi:hypothetical protein